jgi:Rps23 Pro-64 3,4-dihydroxylase Tpa1-like proline 4-hydroxylase
MINKKLNISDLSNEYAIHRRLYVKDLLEEAVAEKLLYQLQELEKQSLWYKADYAEKPKGTPNNLDPYMKELESQFAYSYQKYPLHNQGHASVTAHDSSRAIPANIGQDELSLIERKVKYQSLLGEFVSYFNSGEGKSIIEQLTSHEFSDNGLTCYASRYTANDFNNIHTDYMPTRKVTMVLYLSKQWIANWGGITCILDDKAEDILEAYSPKFNSAIFFDVPLFHMVTPISTNCKQWRYTLTNWFHNYQQP